MTMTTTMTTTMTMTMSRDTHSAAGEREHPHDERDSLAAAHRDNNLRAAIIHVAADAAVSVLVIVGLLLARTFGWLWRIQWRESSVLA